MRIYANKAFGFRNPDDRKLVVTKPGEFQSVPDWIGSDKTFKLAVGEGSIEVIQQAATSSASSSSRKAASRKTAGKTDAGLSDGDSGAGDGGAGTGTSVDQGTGE
ncbi:MAG: hypothetical protein A4E65_00333 [Syntrophorhabdus sp. PtaU1.Bin153]|nr:MAG: hypothetical protein A4E65_00333 [Syntrophorhabdus sp. PtaU1.Bin153]